MKENPNKEDLITSLFINTKSLKMAVDDYRKSISEFNYTKINSEAALCSDMDLIAMTVDGAAKRLGLLSIIKPFTVLVEEAACELEPHIVTVICNFHHLIMIGDHFQLQPSCNVDLLAVEHNFTVSFFECLLRLEFHFNVLNVQHRMALALAELITLPTAHSSSFEAEEEKQYEALKQILYKDLTSADSTSTFSAWPSMGGRHILFYSHNETI